MARPAADKQPHGTIQEFKDARGRTYWRVRVTTADRERLWVGPRFYDKQRAREKADEEGRKAAGKTLNQIAPPPPTQKTPDAETSDGWYERFKEYRRKEVGSVDDDAWRWAKWISPRIGPKAIADVTADDVEDVRDALNEAVLAYEAAGNEQGEGRLAPKTAANIWCALTTPFKYASTRKGPRDLRVREAKGNPCLGIPPPRRGTSKRRHWLRPDQFAKLVACTEVPREWRDAYAVGLYLHLRPGELHELRVKDLDLEAGEVRICRAYDERTKAVTTPKTDEGVRPVTVPRTLLPLLKRLAKDQDGDVRVCPVVSATPEKSRAGIFRDHLGVAKIDAPAFFVETATHLMIDFRSLRDSGITWRFLAEHRAEVVQREAGHEHIATTLGYAKEVQDRRGRYGEPFPPLPDDPDPGDASKPASKDATAILHTPRITRHSESGRRDLKPTQDQLLSGFSGVIEGSATPAIPRSPQDNPAIAGGLDAGLDADPVDLALANALIEATAAGQWGVVGQLARELEARRTARARNVIPLPTKTRRS